MERLPEVREAFGTLARSLKRIAIYRHARDKHASYLEPALGALQALLEKEPAVTVQVEPAALVYAEEAVYTEPAREGSLCFRMHRDGVRTLTFTRGLTLPDLLTFMEVALPDSAVGPGREDAVTELWKADLRFISYSAVSGYRMEQTEAEREGVQSAIDEVSERAQRALERFAEDLDEDSARNAPPALGDAERRELDAGDWGTLARRATMTLLEIMQRSYAGRDLESLIEAYGRLVDEMLERKDPASLGLAIARATGVQGPQAAPFRLALGKRLADAARAQQLLELARATPGLLSPWFGLLPDDAGEVLLDAMEQEPSIASRAALAQAAAARLEHCRTAFAGKLQLASPDVVRPLLAVLQERPAQVRAAVAVSALQHKALQVKVDAMPLVAADPELALKALAPLISDANPQLRVAAADSIGALTGKRDEAAALLLSALGSHALEQAERAELAAFHRALGRLRTDPGFAWLEGRLADPRRRLLNRKRTEEEQLLAVQGLAAEASERGLRALDAAVAAAHSPAVTAASKAAAHRVRQTLTKRAEEGA